MGITTLWRKSAAAGTLQALLDYQKKQGMLAEFSTVEVCNRAVRIAWEWQPDLFEGRTGPKPHKVATAAFAAGVGAMFEKSEGREAQQNALLFAMAMIFQDIGKNGHQYPFHHVDHHLLSMAQRAMEKAQAEMDEEHGEFFKMMGI